jgi:hypothetical protein
VIDSITLFFLCVIRPHQKSFLDHIFLLVLVPPHQNIKTFFSLHTQTQTQTKLQDLPSVSLTHSQHKQFAQEGSGFLGGSAPHFCPCRLLLFPTANP